MKLNKVENEFGTQIKLSDENKILSVYFGGTLDLYWSIRTKIENDYSFDITKENYAVYKLFEQLFDDIKNINIFERNMVPFYIDSEEEKKEYVLAHKQELELENKRYRLCNYSNYNELFDELNNTITWYSDETCHEVANILKIKKENEKFTIEFMMQPYIRGYVRDVNSAKSITIRFSNSGSRYDPFNTIFMRMYNNMKEIDDTNDLGHQMHIEEYLYNLNKVKKLKK